jgi:hypothetical protein
MTTTTIRAGSLDHVEVLVPDRYLAAGWYKSVLGLEIVPEFEHWAQSESGPLMLACADGLGKLALFAGVPRGQHPSTGHDRVAFRVSGEEFLRFVAESSDLPVYSDDGSPAPSLQPKDHGQS